VGEIMTGQQLFRAWVMEGLCFENNYYTWNSLEQWRKDRWNALANRLNGMKS